ncbi:HAD hydrolase-like protein [Amnibacterium sp.]|uniref:HAD hydrolase-like protein n=1 Tax=Amnibacterium sp. TaxID=1872496 RepID=UPI0026167E9C|nr:HAD hydrolase-like protein [Amnibacterium sp.]MCU1473424.1 family hydrolase [Amnibacterium sp.]
MPEETTAPFTVALVDLDGTIMDSAPGITSTLTRTLERMGLPVPPPSRLVEFVGPPILDGLRDLAGLDPEQSQTALRLYRTEYRETGAFDAQPYPGIREALETIRAAGPTLAVATSKPEQQAKRILAHFGLDDLFTVIAGASEDETRSEKADVITWALCLLAEAGVDASRPVMIGDRIHDVEGAAVHGIPVVFAAWGYGDPAEAAGSIAVASSPAELPEIVTTR